MRSFTLRQFSHNLQFIGKSTINEDKEKTTRLTGCGTSDVGWLREHISARALGIHLSVSASQGFAPLFPCFTVSFFFSITSLLCSPSWIDREWHELSQEESLWRGLSVNRFGHLLNRSHFLKLCSLQHTKCDRAIKLKVIQKIIVDFT